MYFVRDGKQTFPSLFSFNRDIVKIERRLIMKNKLLHSILLLTSAWALQILINPAVIAIFHQPAPAKIAPAIPYHHINPTERGKYSPSELHRIYFYERVHQSIEKGIKAKVI